MSQGHAGEGRAVPGNAADSTAAVMDGAGGAPTGSLDRTTKPEGAQAPDADAEDRYWHDNYLSRPYTDDTLSYDHYRPAYRYGWESRTRFAGRRWDEVERELEKGWRESRGQSRLGWTDARQAARDAWQRVDNRMLDERERDEGLTTG
jgi:hypothetical protein